MQRDDFEMVVGLELHAQLNTLSKAYSSDANLYGQSPNTQLSELTLALPGTLPVINKQVYQFAIKMGLACNCSIEKNNGYARKNYFYADMPKGYQITQDKTPICYNGKVRIEIEEGDWREIGITRIHMEEDSGKSIHDLDPYNSLIDLNRAGVPLIEIVSDPDLRSPEEAQLFVLEMRKLLRYLEICDGNMEEGSLRCDANISIRKKGEKSLGTKVEIKNMNSPRNVRKALEFEFERQSRLVLEGKTIEQETRGFNAANSQTVEMRSKEMAHDYRYFPEPDLPPLILTEKDIEEVRKEMPILPNDLVKKLTEEYQLSNYDAKVLTEEKQMATLFLDLYDRFPQAKACANLLIGPIKSWLNQNAKHLSEFPLGPDALADFLGVIEEGKISTSKAYQDLFPAMVESPNSKAIELAKEGNLLQESNDAVLLEKAKEIIAANPQKVEAYKAGQKGLLGFFMGQLMKETQGKANPQVANRLIKDLLDA